MADKVKTTTIGLVGGIASGKSFVASRLVALGAISINADTIGHEVLKKPLVIRRLTQIFGGHIKLDSGAIDRGRLAAEVFGDDQPSRDRLRLLESVVHPLIHAEAVQRLLRFKEATPPATMVVLDASLLLEAQWEPLCDIILFVDTPHEVRLQRAIARGWSETDFDRREAAQSSLDTKRRAATHLVSGIASQSELDRKLQQICLRA